MTGGDLGGNNDLCLLSLDGGGVRGLSSLYILRCIMVKMNAERQKRGESDAKPCEVFDLIGGTSTGGLIAILLGRLEMNVDECLTVFKDAMCEIFGRRVHSAKFKLRNGQLQHGFSPDKLKEAIQKALILKNIPIDEPYDNGQERTCRTFVVARRVESNSHVLIRDYTLSGEENYDKLTIVEAALATSAASTFFPPLEANGKLYVDGALGDNNPTPLVYQLAQDTWARDDGRLDSYLNCFISIGTGRPGFSGIESSALAFLSKTLKEIATQTEETEQKFAKTNRCLLNKPEEQVYFRFNVDSGLDSIGLEEHDKADVIEIATFNYLEQYQWRKFELGRCARRISQKQKPDNEWIKPPSATKFSNVPQRHRYFVGRDGDLDTLRRRLSPSTKTAESKPKSCLIHGMGGMGKTQLSRAYSDDSNYDFHFWV
ncbi:putative patatin-like phospholipase [Rosellinia necatrix]|uniref:Putative patatin-like phospholipase n=1 Tax=Rosellinia necatrix TaxID=77044 RepID=A0A1S8A995_ROSNE|nr:putative patatin-like phospholipase [Rosellinia necatrix]